jgi:carboxyl-terminal processing protease
MSSARLPLWFLVANWVVVCAAFVLGIVLGRRTPLPDPQATAIRIVYDEIQRSYVDQVDGPAMLDRAIAAMARLDDYSRYIPQLEVPRFVEETTGTYEGIGVVLHFAEDGVFVRIPVDGGPGDRAGLMPGDLVVSIDGTRIADLAARERTQLAEERLRGAAGSHVTIVIARDGEERTMDVERAAVQKSSVKWAQMLDADRGLGYVHLADFHPGSQKALARELETLGKTHGGLRGVVLDLRFDLGGSLDEAVAIARMFVEAGNIVSLRRRDSEVLERFDADTTQCTFPDLPMVVIVNESSASASEVLAGALQDHARAAIVGTATYGKGVVNTIYEWHGQPFRLKLTTARYFTPSGRNLDRGRHRNGTPTTAKREATSTAESAASTDKGGGIHPDREQALDDAVQEAAQRALAEFPVPEHHRDALTRWALARNSRVPGILLPSEDRQLQVAIEVLRERIGGG